MKEFVTLDCIYRNKVGISEGGIGVNELSILDLKPIIVSRSTLGSPSNNISCHTCTNQKSTFLCSSDDHNDKTMIFQRQR